MSDRREYPFSEEWEAAEELPRLYDDAPDTEIQSVMEAAPGDVPRPSKESQLEVRDAIAAAVDALPDRERWVFNAWAYEGKSLQDIACDLSLSKTQVHNILGAARLSLQNALQDLHGN